MADLILDEGELDWSITDDEAGQALVAYFRAHPRALPKKVKAAVAQAAIMQDQINRTIEEADAEERRAKFSEWVELFLSGRKSKETRKNYQYALDRLLAFCRAEGIDAACLTYEQARRFTTSPQLANNNKRGGRRAEQSIRTDIAAVSSLYSELDRLSEGKIRNPFLRIDTKPGKERASDKAVPTAKELSAILANTSGQVRAAIAVMAYRGLRIGALPELTLATRDGKTTFNAFTKGKPQAGVMPSEAMDAIEQAGLSRKKPFEGAGVKTLTKRIERELDRLAGKGLIAGHTAERMINKKIKTVTVSDYSCHGFRHFYAVAQYEATRDIEKVRRLLNHADLNTTQAYLQSLGLLEE